LPDIEVNLVRTDDDVGRFILWLKDAVARGEAIAIDTETRGLDWWTFAFTRLVQFGTRDEGWAIPVEWWGKVIEYAMGMITDAHASVIMHNAKHDMHALEVQRYPIPDWANVHDTAGS
jgi:DNA polymerase I-like protein with 3'-5' exonuclease and polymerase domains